MKKVLITILLASIIVGCSPSTKSVSNNDTTKTATSVTTQSKVTTSVKSNSSTSTKEVTKPQTKPNDEIIGKVLDFEKETVKIEKIEKVKDVKGKKAIRVTFAYTNKSNDKDNGKGMYIPVTLAMNVRAYQNDNKLNHTRDTDHPEKSGNNIEVRPVEGETVSNCYWVFLLDSIDEDVKFEFKPGRDTEEVKSFVYKNEIVN